MSDATDVRTPLTALIADDEPLGRQALRRFLAADGAVTVVAEAVDVPSLVAALRTTTPDVLFLDVTMPGGSGLDAVPHLGSATTLVFTTAHAEHAVRAFDLDAADYLLKPFGATRVAEALQRVRRRRSPAVDASAREALRVLLVRIGTRLVPVAVGDILRFEGADDCVRIVTADRAWFHGATLSDLEAKLDPALFVRVHRRHLVNLAHVTGVEPADDRRLALRFADGSAITCSRTGSALVRRLGRQG
ncbi:MAG: LytTR family DNA-binding domain-containing protein [Gemmatimonadaceae bacterium]|nr:LytTR family DNA-binding domain-containing protein [Gemmatimonadaceae bacterium]